MHKVLYFSNIKVKQYCRKCAALQVNYRVHLFYLFNVYIQFTAIYYPHFSFSECYKFVFIDWTKLLYL